MAHGGHGNNKCIICYRTTIADLQAINNMLAAGYRQYEVIKAFPHLSITTSQMSGHAGHYGDPANTERVLNRKLLEAMNQKNYKEFNLEGLIERTKARIAAALDKTMSVVETHADDAENGLIQAKELVDAWKALNLATDSLDSYTGLKQHISIDAAVNTLTKEGYKIASDPIDGANAISALKDSVNYLDYLKLKEIYEPQE